MSDLTVEERIKAIQEKGWMIAWDGCHKAYFLTNPEQIADASATGYQIYAARELPRIWEKSCFLRFVSTWPLLEGDEGSEFIIEQFEEVEEVDHPAGGAGAWSGD